MKNLRNNSRGFTLIELMIVIGIIAVLVAVLALAVLPWLSKSAENSTKAVLSTVGGQLDTKNIFTMDRFRKDVGSSLAGQIDSDPKKGSAQLLMFYLAPTKEAWDKSTYYKGQQYAPKIEKKDVAEFTKTSGSAPDLPYLTDGWNTEFWYYYDKPAKLVIIRSAGKDMQWDTEDDLAFDGGSNTVKHWSDMKKQ